MNSYLDYIFALNHRLEHEYLPDKSFVLYHKILHRFNKSFWADEWLTVDNLNLMADIGVKKEESLIIYRDKLITEGFLDYRRGKKGSPSKYKLLLTEKGAQKGVQKGVQMGVQMGVQEGGLIKDKREKNKDKDIEKENTKKKTAFGEFQNVFLTDEEICKIKERISNYLELIERLSTYIASKGVSYQSHYATLLQWAARELEKKDEKKLQNTSKRQPNFTQRKTSYSDIEDEYFEQIIEGLKGKK